MSIYWKNLKRGSLLILLTISVQSHANLIRNGSFEDSELVPNDVALLSVGDSSLTGWEIVQGNIDYYHSTSSWAASDGDRYIDLDRVLGVAGGLEQTFATTAGNSYQIQFDLAGNPEGGFTMKPIIVSADNQIAYFSIDSMGQDFADIGWTTLSWSFVADDDFATLNFQSFITPTGYGAVLDNINVVQVQIGNISNVPVPSAVWLFGSAMAGLLGARKKLSETVSR